MYAKHSAVDDSTQSEIIKYFAAPPPHIAASILALTLVIKSVHLCDLPRFMVPSNECYPFRISDLQSKQQKECFNAVKPPINEIA